MKMGMGQVAVGDVVPMPGQDRGIFSDGPARWYALRVAPQREDQAEQWLSRRGVYGFHPVQTRRLVRAGAARVYHRRYLPGYVFARFPGEPMPHRVLDCVFITGALTMTDGHWGVLEARKLQSIHAMRKVDADNLARQKIERARRRLASLVAAGDAAMFRAGPFEGFPCEVVEIEADGGARVQLRLFGREHMISSAPEDLIPLRKAG